MKLKQYELNRNTQKWTCYHTLMFLLLLMVFSTSSVSAAPVQRDGFIAYVSSNTASFKTISNAEELAQIANDLSGQYVLTEDIDLSGSSWQPIGTTHGGAFKGVLEGNGHVITGLTVSESFNSGTVMAPSYTVGLFGVCDGAVIRNLGLENVNISITTTSGYRYVSNLDAEFTVFAGAITGYAENGTVIHNCYTTGSVRAHASGEGYSATIAGGLVGYGNDVTVRLSANHCTVKAYNGNAVEAYDSYAGGLIGRAGGNGEIHISENSGAVTAQTLDYGKAYAGGLVGCSTASAFEISDAYNSADIIGLSGNNFCDPAYAGGIAAKYSGHITRCYNSGMVTAQAKDPYGINHSVASAGGICGEADADSLISNCASVAADVYVSASGTRSQYRISNNGQKNNNVTNTSVAANSQNDADLTASESDFTQAAIWGETLGWDLSSVWVVDNAYPTFMKNYYNDEEWSSSLDWFISDEGVLVISGKGDMPEWGSAEEVPWHLHASEILKIQIGDGITSIGPYAFYWCARCEEVEIGASVRSIGGSSFTGCTKLSEIVIPAGIERIENCAFLACGAQKYRFEGKAPEIIDGAFYEVHADVYYHSDRGEWENVAGSGYGGELKWVDLYLVENGMIDAGSVTYKNAKKDGTYLTDAELPATPSAKASQYAAELYGWACDYGCEDILTQDVCSQIIYKYMPTVVSAEDGGVFTEDQYKTWEIMRDILMINSTKNALNMWETKYLADPKAKDLDLARKKLIRILGVYTSYTEEVQRSPIQTAIYNVYSLKIVKNAFNSIWKIVKENAVGYEEGLLEESLKNYDINEVLGYLSDAKAVLKEDGLNAIAADIGWTARETWEDIAENGAKSVVKAITKDVKGTIVETLYNINPGISEIRDLYQKSSEYVGLYKKYTALALYAPEVILAVELLQLGKEVLETAGDVKTAQYFMIQYYVLHVKPDMYDAVIDEAGNIIDSVTWLQYTENHDDIDPIFAQLMYNWYEKGSSTLVDEEKKKAVTNQASTASCLQNMTPDQMKREVVEYWADRMVGVSVSTGAVQIQVKTGAGTDVVVVDKDGNEIGTYSSETGFQPLTIAARSLKIAVKKAKEVSGAQNENILFITDEEDKYLTTSFISEDYGIRICQDMPAIAVDVKAADETEYACIYNNVPEGTVLYVVDGEIIAKTSDGEILEPAYQYTKAQDLLKQDLDNLEIAFQGDDSEKEVTRNVSLPLSGMNGSEISWTSDKPETLSAEGAVNRTTENTIVRLTATAVSGEFSASREFEITVKGTLTKVTCFSALDGAVLGTLSVEEGNTILSEELTGVIPDGAVLSGWYYDLEKLLPYHSWEAIFQETALYADYEIDKTLHFTKQPQGASYLINEVPEALTIAFYPEEEAAIQWYRNETAEITGDTGTALVGQTEKSFLPDTSAPGTSYYYAIVQIGENQIISDTACIEVRDPNVLASGNCGELAEWRLGTDGTLVVYGSSEIPDYEDIQTIPWYEYESQISAVEIREGITRIGLNVFANLTEVKKMTAAKSIQSIAEGAFAGCSSLEELTVPFVGTGRNVSGAESVLGAVFGKVPSGGTVQYHALNGTSLSGYRYGIPASLKSVTITDASDIGFGAFYNCSELDRIQVNEGIESVERYAFANCSGLTEFTVPSTVTHISEGALSGCVSLENLTIPFVGSSATSNNDYDAVLGVIFGGVSEGVVQYYSLEGTSLSGASYAIPDSLRTVTLTNEKRIPVGAFCNCAHIQEIHLSAEISEIGLYAFFQCSGLTDIYYDADRSRWEAIEKDLRGNDVLETVMMHYKAAAVSSERITIGAAVTEIGDEAFEGCQNVKAICFEGDMPVFGTDAFKGLSEETVVYYPVQNTTWEIDALREAGFEGEVLMWDSESGLVVD